MREIIGAVTAIIVVAAVAFIGLGVIEMTYSQVNNTAPSTGLTNFHEQTHVVFDTLGGMLPILVLAMVGGLAIFYILRYLAGSARE